MGLSSSKSKTKSEPAAFASPYLNQALSSTQGVFNSNQQNLQDLAGKVSQGFSAIAPAAFSPSPYVTAAQGYAQGIASGKNIGTNPGASTYAGLMQGGVNPAAASLSSIANGANSNPALAAYGNLLNGGDNSALAGLQSTAYGTGSLGAGDPTLSSFAARGNNGQSNYADSYDRSVLDGKYLNNNPYIDAIAQQATDAATKASNQRFGMTGLGAGLSSAYTGALGSAVADANNTVRFENYNNERGRQEAASGRVSTNYNAGQDRALSGANALSAGSRSDAAFRLGALNDLSAANQARTTNQLNAAQGLGSVYSQGQQNQISAANGLGSIYNQGQQTQLNAAQAADQSYQNLLTQQLQALGYTGSLEDAKYAGINPALNLAGAAATIPYSGVNAYSDIVNGLTGRYGTTTTKNSPSGLQVIGQLAQIGSAFMPTPKPGGGGS